MQLAIILVLGLCSVPVFSAFSDEQAKAIDIEKDSAKLLGQIEDGKICGEDGINELEDLRKGLGSEIHPCTNKAINNVQANIKRLNNELTKVEADVQALMKDYNACKRRPVLFQKPCIALWLPRATKVANDSKNRMNAEIELARANTSRAISEANACGAPDDSIIAIEKIVFEYEVCLHSL